MILITGAGGKTGLAVIAALNKTRLPGGATIRALVHRPGHGPNVLEAGAHETFEGDLMDSPSLRRACENVETIYHICPNLHPKEVDIGRALIAAAKAAGVPRIVFHSVLHPQIEAMPHHWRKLRVEEMLITSGLDFTILQPGALMQNLLVHWPRMREEGVLPVPYDTSSRFSLVDLEDVAEVAAHVLTEPGHGSAVYPLSGPQDLSHDAMAEILTRVLGRRILAVTESFSPTSGAQSLDAPRLEALVAMFDYYDRHGFLGNAKPLRWLLGREPRSFRDFALSQS